MPDNDKLETLVNILETGNQTEIEELLWQPKASKIAYLPITFDLVSKLKRPEQSSEKLSIHKLILKKNFALIIFNTPWTKDGLGFLPLIIETSSNKIVGVMLPFNELNDVLSKKQSKEISDLGMCWTMFAMDKRFGLNLG